MSLFFICFSMAVAAQSDKRLTFSVTENDTNTYQLHLALLADGSPSHFYRNIFTPVCITGECKPVYVNFYWDLLGNYMRYDLPEGEILTKMDHDEFTPDDYQKLQSILINSSSLLKDVAMEDLISTGTEQLADSVDAKTGATMKAIKNEVIDGAVYTCYTLWHIAYGKVVTSRMKAITDSLRTDALLHTFLQSTNHHYQYWALEKVMLENGQCKPAYLEDVKKIIQGKNIFAARSTLQRIASSQLTPEWIWELYQSSNYSFQIEVLKKLQNYSLSTALQQKVVGELAQANEAQAQLLLQVLASQKSLAKPTLRNLSELLLQSGGVKSEKIYTLLVQQSSIDKYVKQALTTYQKSQ